MKEALIGLGIGLVIAIVVYIWQKIGKNEIEKKSKAEIARLKGLLADRMDIESEGITKLKKENEELYAMVAKNEQDIKLLQEKLEQGQNDYQSLKMAKMIEITDGDLDGAKERLSKLIRDVNKCIAILSDEEQ